MSQADPRRWSQLALLAAVELLAMALWFSATAVKPALQVAWDLNDSQGSWLTISVQLGFVAGALASAVLNLSERIAPPLLMAGCALVGGLLNFLIPAVIDDQLARGGEGFYGALGLRFWTGMMLAGVYPTGM